MSTFSTLAGCAMIVSSLLSNICLSSSYLAEVCVVEGPRDQDSYVSINNWNGDDLTIGQGFVPYMEICRLSAAKGKSLPFAVSASHSTYNIDNSNSIIAINKLIILIMDGTSSVEITFDSSNDNSPLMNTSPLLGDSDKIAEFTLNGGEYKLKVSKSRFNMEFTLDNGELGSFDITLRSRKDYGYSLVIVEATSSLAGYICGVCGQL